MKKRSKTILKSIALIVILIVCYLYLDSILFDGIHPEPIKTSEFKATFYTKQNIKHRPTIVLIGGGIWGDYWGQELAKAKYVGLSLPYCNLEGLPKLPENIPLEYFKTAIDWLKEQPQVNPNNIIIMGASRNAELALLIASYYPETVHGVIAYSPSSVSWSNTALPYNSNEIKASWTFNNTPVPYIPMSKLKGGELESIETLSYWTQALLNNNNVNKASIKIENINGPILLFSGIDDQVWPSAMMSDMIENRSHIHNFKFELENIKYKDAGHLISGNPNNKSSIKQGQMVINGKQYSFKFGGTETGDLAAQQDAKKRVFNYLSKL